MAEIITGYKRSITITVRKFSGNTIIDETTYDGLNGFIFQSKTYDTISLFQLGNLSETEYNNRLSDFIGYVKTLEPNVNFNSPISGNTVYDVSCFPDSIVYSGGFFDYQCENFDIDYSCDYKFSLLGMYGSDKGFDSNYPNQLTNLNNLLANNILTYNQVYTFLFNIEAKINNNKPAPIFEVLFREKNENNYYDYAIFNTKIIGGYGNDEIIDDYSHNFYGIDRQYIKTKVGIASFKPEYQNTNTFTASTVSNIYSIRFAPYVFGNILTPKEFVFSIKPINYDGNYSYCYNTDDSIEFSLKYYNDNIFCNIFPTTILQTNNLIKISNNTNANLAKIRTISGDLIGSISIPEYENYIEISLSPYNLVNGKYLIELLRSDNSIMKKTEFIVI